MPFGHRLLRGSWRNCLRQTRLEGVKYVATPRTVGLTESYSVDAYSLQDTEIETIDTFSEGICGVIDGLHVV